MLDLRHQLQRSYEWRWTSVVMQIQVIRPWANASLAIRITKESRLSITRVHASSQFASQKHVVRDLREKCRSVHESTPWSHYRSSRFLQGLHLEGGSAVRFIECFMASGAAAGFGFYLKSSPRTWWTSLENFTFCKAILSISDSGSELQPDGIPDSDNILS